MDLLKKVFLLSRMVFGSRSLLNMLMNTVKFLSLVIVVMYLSLLLIMRNLVLCWNRLKRLVISLI